MRHFNPDFLNRPRKRNNPEGILQLQIIRYCKARGFIIGKIKNKGSRIGNRFIFDPYAFLGLPDLLLFANNKMYFVEVKSPEGGQQSEYQIAFQNYCIKANIPYILVRDISDIEKIVK